MSIYPHIAAFLEVNGFLPDSIACWSQIARCSLQLCVDVGDSKDNFLGHPLHYMRDGAPSQVSVGAHHGFSPIRRDIAKRCVRGWQLRCAKPVKSNGLQPLV